MWWTRTRARPKARTQAHIRCRCIRNATSRAARVAQEELKARATWVAAKWRSAGKRRVRGASREAVAGAKLADLKALRAITCVPQAGSREVADPRAPRGSRRKRLRVVG